MPRRTPRSSRRKPRHSPHRRWLKVAPWKKVRRRAERRLPEVTRITRYRYPSGTVRHGKKVGGQFVKKGVKITPAMRKEKETFDFRRTLTGKLAEGISVTTKRISVRSVEVPMTGRNQGLIGRALELTNIFTQLKGARLLEVFLAGTDYRGRRHRFKLSLPVEGLRNLADLMMDRIQAYLTQQGWRPQYNLDVVNWRESRTARSASRSLAQLGRLKVMVKVYR